MKKVFVMGSVLLLGTALTFAQDTNSRSSSSQTGASTSSQSGTTGASSQTTADQTGTTSTTQQTTTTTTEQTTSGNAIRGCLSGSSGNWMLTDATGVSYRLLGSDSQLSENANKEVEVMGTPGTSSSASASNSPDNSAGASAGSTGNTPDNNTGTAGSSTAHASASSTKTLDVTSVRKVADSCTNMNQTAPQQ